MKWVVNTHFFHGKSLFNPLIAKLSTSPTVTYIIPQWNHNFVIIFGWFKKLLLISFRNGITTSIATLHKVVGLLLISFRKGITTNQPSS